jgi:hypothetical protein
MAKSMRCARKIEEEILTGQNGKEKGNKTWKNFWAGENWKFD